MSWTASAPRFARRSVLAAALLLIAALSNAAEAPQPNVPVWPDYKLPDLSVDDRPAAIDPSEHDMDFPNDHCAVLEGCVRPGRRRLLRFNTRIHNFGQNDLMIGNPYHDTNQTVFHYNACHQHFHWPNVLEARLEDASGTTVVRGQKIGFCLTDFLPAAFPPPPLGRARYDCAHQGLSEGWSDLYAKDLDCQWIDITDVTPGNYKLVLQVNAQRKFVESRYDNNMATIDVAIGSPPPSQRPANDLCSAAYQMQLNTHYTIHTRGATGEGMVCGGVQEPVSSIWYKIRGTGERLLASTCNQGTTMDTVMLIYRTCPAGATDCEAGSLTCVGSADDTDCGSLAYVQWCSEPGVDYFVVVGGARDLTGTVDTTVTAIADKFTSLYEVTASGGAQCSGPVVLCPGAGIGAAAAAMPQAQPAAPPQAVQIQPALPQQQGPEQFGVASDAFHPATAAANSDLLQQQQLLLQHQQLLMMLQQQQQRQQGVAATPRLFGPINGLGGPASPTPPPPGLVFAPHPSTEILPGPA